MVRKGIQIFLPVATDLLPKATETRETARRFTGRPTGAGVLGPLLPALQTLGKLLRYSASTRSLWTAGSTTGIQNWAVCEITWYLYACTMCAPSPRQRSCAGRRRGREDAHRASGCCIALTEFRRRVSASAVFRSAGMTTRRSSRFFIFKWTCGVWTQCRGWLPWMSRCK